MKNIKKIVLSCVLLANLMIKSTNFEFPGYREYSQIENEFQCKLKDADVDLQLNFAKITHAMAQTRFFAIVERKRIEESSTMTQAEKEAMLKEIDNQMQKGYDSLSKLFSTVMQECPHFSDTQCVKKSGVDFLFTNK